MSALNSDSLLNGQSARRQKLLYYDTAIKKFVEQQGQIVKIKNRLNVVNSKHEKMKKKINRFYQNVQRQEESMLCNNQTQEEMQKLRLKIQQQQQQLRKMHSLQRENHYKKLNSSVCALESEKHRLRDRIMKQRQLNNRAILDNKENDLKEKKMIRDKIIQQNEKSRILKMSFFTKKSENISEQISKQIHELTLRRGNEQKMKYEEDIAQIKDLQAKYEDMKRSFCQKKGTQSSQRQRKSNFKTKQSVHESEKQPVVDRFQKLIRKCRSRVIY